MDWLEPLLIIAAFVAAFVARVYYEKWRLAQPERFRKQMEAKRRNDRLREERVREGRDPDTGAILAGPSSLFTRTPQRPPMGTVTCDRREPARQSDASK